MSFSSRGYALSKYKEAYTVYISFRLVGIQLILHPCLVCSILSLHEDELEFKSFLYFHDTSVKVTRPSYFGVSCFGFLLLAGRIPAGN